MTPTRKSCIVAFPKECNYATSPSTNATSCATVPQPTSLKTLAAKVLTRNQQRNRDATNTKQPCNFFHENRPGKLHSFAECNQDATTRPLPPWCRADCPGLESIDLPGEGEVVGCANPTTGAWRRLDWLSTCPAAPTPRKGTPPWPPPLASWCKPDCDRLHLSDGVAWCCSEQDERHWSRRRIGAMNACPKEALI